jgi:hypothetical protein
LTQSIIDSARSCKRVAVEPWKAALVKLDSIQDLRVPRESDVETVDSRKTALYIDYFGGEPASLEEAARTCGIV